MRRIPPLIILLGGLIAVIGLTVLVTSSVSPWVNDTTGLPGDSNPHPGARGVSQNGSNPCMGTITEPPAGTTLVTIQGFRFDPRQKTPGLLVGVAPDGQVIGVHNNSAHSRRWTYDVDPLSNGNLLLATTEPGITVVEEINPITGEHVKVQRYPGVTDAHDVDLINNGTELVMADKGKRHNRIVAFDSDSREVTWEWQFDSQYPTSGGGPYPRDWTHVNDVDRIGNNEYLVSVRNFDQVIVVNRSTDQIGLRLGRDDDHAILFEQHNPQYLVGENNTPTILVADSRNDRVVEYSHRNGDWRLTWELSGGSLNEPRDADRLPNGNTLVVDRLGHRTLEVTPTGEIVWEFYTPWQPYDAERYRLGDEPGGPTMGELNVPQSVSLQGSANFSRGEIEACSTFLNTFSGDGRLIQHNES